MVWQPIYFLCMFLDISKKFKIKPLSLSLSLSLIPICICACKYLQLYLFSPSSPSKQLLLFVGFTIFIHGLGESGFLHIIFRSLHCGNLRAVCTE